VTNLFNLQIDFQLSSLKVHARLPKRFWILESIIPLGAISLFAFYAISKIFNDDNAFLLQRICFFLQLLYLTGVSLLSYICCFNLQRRFHCINKVLLQLRVCQTILNSLDNNILFYLGNRAA